MPEAKPVALITGSGTGVGRACALRFAKLGYRVVINYSRSQCEAEQTAHEVQGLGTECMLAACDVSQEEAIRGMMEDLRQRWGRLDVLINNAATTNFIPLDALEEMDEEKWDRILAVNLKGPYLCTRAAVPLLRQGESPAIVNVSSIAGLRGQGSCMAYAASKGGLNTLTKSLAHALAPDIRVNAVLPGPIDSRWIRESNSGWDLETMTSAFPIPRPSQPDDIADTVVYLAVGTKMQTGQLLVVDGGSTMPL